MSLVINRSAGDSSRINLQWTDSAGAAVDLTIFGGTIVLQWERADLALLELPAVIDDAPQGLAHFEPTPAQMIAGQHFLRVKGVVTSTTEEMYFPDGDPVCLNVAKALQSNV